MCCYSIHIIRLAYDLWLDSKTRTCWAAQCYDYEHGSPTPIDAWGATIDPHIGWRECARLRACVRLPASRHGKDCRRSNSHPILAVCDSVGLSCNYVCRGYYSECCRAIGKHSGTRSKQLYPNDYARTQSNCFSSFVAWPFFSGHWSTNAFFLHLTGTRNDL